MNLNSTRIWLSYQQYERDPQGYIDRVRKYIRTSQKLGFSTMPILWNGNNLNPDTVQAGFPGAWRRLYVKGIVEAIKDEPGLLMWDIMNEPLTNPYWASAEKDEKQKRGAKLPSFYAITSLRQEVEPGERHHSGLRDLIPTGSRHGRPGDVLRLPTSTPRFAGPWKRLTRLAENLPKNSASPC